MWRRAMRNDRGGRNRARGPTINGTRIPIGMKAFDGVAEASTPGRKPRRRGNGIPDDPSEPEPEEEKPAETEADGLAGALGAWRVDRSEPGPAPEEEEPGEEVQVLEPTAPGSVVDLEAGASP